MHIGYTPLNFLDWGNLNSETPGWDHFFWVARVLGYWLVPLVKVLRPLGYLPGPVEGKNAIKCNIFIYTLYDPLISLLGAT